MAGHFDPEKFDDRYEDALRDLIKRKAAGEKITPAQHPRPKATTNLMDALRASLAGTQKRPPAASVHRRSAGEGRKPAARSKARRKAPHTTAFASSATAMVAASSRKSP
jgi:DNA end-binding protein Ku